MTMDMAICLMNNDFENFNILENNYEQEKFNMIVVKKKIRTTGAYARFRSSVLKRDDNKCTKCGSIEKLHVHHIKELSIFPELAYCIENGISLCFNCHKELHWGIK